MEKWEIRPPLPQKPLNRSNYYYYRGRTWASREFAGKKKSSKIALKKCNLALASYGTVGGTVRFQPVSQASVRVTSRQNESL